MLYELVRGNFPLTPKKEIDCMSIKRTKKIEIRVSEEEYEQLLQSKTKPRLAQWVRETCLGNEPRKQAKFVSKTDPALLIALARIGGNLNQIARNLNLDKNMALEQKVDYLIDLASIAEDIRELKNVR